ncbi:MAG TPA: glycosyl hydrolase family 8 [Polyangia bacterium]|nr:glycosyl hydrolase family 8 [Polyangia bacterium]
MSFVRLAITLAGTFLAGSMLATAACNTPPPSNAQSCQGRPGAEYCSCAADGSCNAGLVCATDLQQCVHLAGTPLPAATGGNPGAGGSTGNGGGTGNGGSTGAGGNGTGGTHVTGTGATTGAGGNSSGGETGKGGGAGNASAGSGGLARGPTPAANGTNFPFPQNRQTSNCIYPTAYDNKDVLTAYAKWKTDLVTSSGAGGFQRVQRTDSDGLGSPSGATPRYSTVSEGIGYGLVIAVYMGDQALFDNLWKYEQLHLDSNGLMNWSVDASGNTTSVNGNTIGGGAATDADEDMAWALVMADKQWGGSGSLSKSYGALALQQIQNVWNHEIYQSKLAGPGDGWGPTDLFGDINISYFAPAYYRVFKQLDSSHAWEAVTQTVFDTIFGQMDDGSGALSSSNKNTSNGLVPAWCTGSGGASSAGPFNYQYDSCRTPFRIGIDWCFNGTSASTAMTPINPSRGKKYVGLTSAFFSGIGAANIVDGYNLDGTVNSGAHPVSEGQSAAFIGPAAVGAMSSPSYQSFLDASYKLVKGNNLLVGGAYYEESWTVMSLLMMTGNFLDYTQLTPAH